MSDAPYVPARDLPRLFTPRKLFAVGIAMSFFWGFGGLLATLFFFMFGKV